jgi:hypothetical protein
VVDIDDFDPETLEVFSREVLKWLMTVNQAGNQCFSIAEIIKEHSLWLQPSKVLKENN